jgi:hypothetical protein
VRRPRRPSHARDELGPELGFRSASAYRGRPAQVRAGIGRGEVGEDGGGCRTCMQRLGSVPRVPPASRRLRQLLRRPRPTWEQTGIGQGLEGVKECCELKRKQGERAGFLSTATSPAAVDPPQRRRASVVAMRRLQGGVAGGVRENCKGANERGERVPGEGFGFYLPK